MKTPNILNRLSCACGNQKTIKQLLKVIISLLLLAWLINKKVDWRHCVQLAGQAEAGMMILAVALLTVERVLSVVKWRLFLTVKNAQISFWRLFIINYVGGFWGSFLPGSVGADIIRGFYLSRTTSDLSLTVASMAVDRTFSGLALVFLGCLGGWYAGYRAGLEYLHPLILIIALLTLLGIALLFQRRFLRMMDEQVIRRFSAWGFAHTLRKWIIACLEYKKFPGVLAQCFLLSLAMQFVRVLIFCVVALGFNVHVPVIYYLVFTPLISILSMLPVSLNGIGVREAIFMSLFTAYAGMTKNEAFIIPFAVSILTTLTTAAGGIIYMFDRNPGNPAPPPAD